MTSFDDPDDRHDLCHEYLDEALRCDEQIALASADNQSLWRELAARWRALAVALLDGGGN